MKKNFKGLLCTAIALTTLLSFASCGFDTAEPGSSEETKAESVDYLTIYHDFMTGLRSEEYPDVTEDGYSTFGLFRIDSDDIPELVVCTDIRHGSVAELYTIAGGEVVDLGGYGTFGALQYGEGNGIIRSYSAYFGEMSYTYYKLENGMVTFLWSGYDLEYIDTDHAGMPDKYCIYESDPYDGNTDNEYYITDESTFEAALNEYESMITDDTASNGYMLPITEENIEYYTEYYGTGAFDEKAYSAARAEILERISYKEDENLALNYYFCDLDNDGNEDLIYCYDCQDPVVSVYRNGAFLSTTIESEAKAGSLFPSGTGSGLFIDGENGVLIYRYGGHTVGTSLYNGAQAYRLEGTKPVSLWVLYSDEEKFNEKYPDAEDVDKAAEECLSDFEVDYRRMTADYTLINFFDVCEVI